MIHDAIILSILFFIIAFGYSVFHEVMTPFINQFEVRK